MSMKNSSDTIGNRNRDLQACRTFNNSVVPVIEHCFVLKLQLLHCLSFLCNIDNF